MYSIKYKKYNKKYQTEWARKYRQTEIYKSKFLQRRALLRKNKLIRIKAIYAAVDEIKIQRGGACEICGYNINTKALIWHHPKSDNKFDSVSSLINRGRLDLIIREIEKCDLICANCHTIMEREH